MNYLHSGRSNDLANYTKIGDIIKYKSGGKQGLNCKSEKEVIIGKVIEIHNHFLVLQCKGKKECIPRFPTIKEKYEITKGK